MLTVAVYLLVVVLIDDCWLLMMMCIVSCLTPFSSDPTRIVTTLQQQPQEHGMAS